MQKKILIFLAVGFLLVSLSQPVLAAPVPTGGDCTKNSDCALTDRCLGVDGSKKCTTSDGTEGGGATGDTGFGVVFSNPLCSKADASCVKDFPTLLSTIATYVTGLIASIAVLVFMYAGFLYLTSAGSPDKIAKANKAVLYAVIGIAIALAGAGLVAVITAVVGPPPK